MVLLANIASGLILLVLAAVKRQSARAWVLAAALSIVAAGLLVLFVLSDDPYRGDGISRWDARRSQGGAVGWMFGGSLGLMVGLGALLIYAGLPGRGRLVRVGALAAGTMVLVLLTATYVGFSGD